MLVEEYDSVKSFINVGPVPEDQSTNLLEVTDPTTRSSVSARIRPFLCLPERDEYNSL